MTAITLNTAPVEGLRALAAEHGITVEEWDTSTLDGRLRENFQGWCADIGGRPTMVFPAGQDPVERMAVARELVARIVQGGAS